MRPAWNQIQRTIFYFRCWDVMLPYKLQMLYFVTPEQQYLVRDYFFINFFLVFKLPSFKYNQGPERPGWSYLVKRFLDNIVTLFHIAQRSNYVVFSHIL